MYVFGGLAWGSLALFIAAVLRARQRSPDAACTDNATRALAILGGILWAALAFYTNSILYFLPAPEKWAPVMMLVMEAPLIALVIHWLIFRSVRIRQSVLGLGLAIASLVLATALIVLIVESRMAWGP